MRRFLIILLLAGLVLGTLGAVLLIIRGRTPAAPPAPSPETVERARTDLQKEIDACAGDEQCIEKATTRHAVLSQISTLCGAIEDEEARDACVLAVALRQTNTELCGQLTDEQRAGECRDAVAAKEARTSENPELCGMIADDDRLEGCFRIALDGTTDHGACSRFDGRAAEVCLAVVISNGAAAAGDPSLCEGIADERLRFLCTGGDEGNAPIPYAPLDSDGDGLSDDEERRLGTDPNTADTDGDGFDDGTEVKNGFNPLGSGRL